MTSDRARRATAIHLIENDGRIHRVDGPADTFESGFWKVSMALAEELKDGDIYFHRAQDAPSYFGGRIVGYRAQPDGQYAGRIVFLFRADEEHRGVRAGRDGWGREKKIIR